MRNTKHILTMCLLLFALSPCVVKGGMLGASVIEQAKSLNKTRATTQVVSCQYTQTESQQVAGEHYQQLIKVLGGAGCFADSQYGFDIVKSWNSYSKTFSGNSPPKYILYKRLKLDIA